MSPKPRTIGIRIDIESRSRTPIKYGAYRYWEDPDAAVLGIGYSPIRLYPGGARKFGQVRVLGDHPRDVDSFKQILLDPRYEKHAFNANFERIGLSQWLGMEPGTYIDPENWRCSAILANVNGVFGTLDEVARAVRSPIAKDPRGKQLIKFFCIEIPARSKHTCGCVTFHEPKTHPTEFAIFMDYMKQDVVTEAMVSAAFPETPADVQAEYEMDQRINDRGIRHHKKLSEQAVAQVKIERDRLMGELSDMTGCENPNSVKQFREWLDDQGYPMESLAKDARERALDDPLIPDLVAEALTLKGAASLSSVAKHQAALDTRCLDGRIRGSLQFYGAHTGREAGRGIQPQNLPRYEAPRADRVRLLHGRAGTDAPMIAKGTVRASLVPARGMVFATADYSAIEARVLGALTGEAWVNAEFAGPGKIYEATAARMFSIDKDALVAALKACGKCGHCVHCDTRGRGKVSDLALGYAGGAGALVTMGAEAAGIDCGNYTELHRMWEDAGRPGKFWQWQREAHDYPELLRLRDLYRDNRPMTVRFWKLCNRAFDLASKGTGAKFGADGCVTILRDGRHNRMILPSGRSIWYRFAKSYENEKGEVELRTFMGKAKGRGHKPVETHGGKLTENVTQAVARDVLFDLMTRVEAAGIGNIVFHVHDEVVLEVPEKGAEQRLADLLGLMEHTPAWAPPGLVVKGEGKLMERYGK